MVRAPVPCVYHCAFVPFPLFSVNYTKSLTRVCVFVPFTYICMYLFRNSMYAIEDGDSPLSTNVCKPGLNMESNYLPGSGTAPHCRVTA